MYLCNQRRIRPLKKWQKFYRISSQKGQIRIRNNFILDPDPTGSGTLLISRAAFLHVSVIHEMLKAGARREFRLQLRKEENLRLLLRPRLRRIFEGRPRLQGIFEGRPRLRLIFGRNLVPARGTTRRCFLFFQTLEEINQFAFLCSFKHWKKSINSKTGRNQ